MSCLSLNIDKAYLTKCVLCNRGFRLESRTEQPKREVRDREGKSEEKKYKKREREREKERERERRKEWSKGLNIMRLFCSCTCTSLALRNSKVTSKKCFVGDNYAVLISNNLLLLYTSICEIIFKISFVKLISLYFPLNLYVLRISPYLH